MTETTARAEIHATADDSYAPHALIGWVEKADYPVGTWIAILPDLDDVMHDPQPPKSWSNPLASAEVAEARVRANYRRWVARQDAVQVHRGFSGWNGKR